MSSVKERSRAIDLSMEFPRVSPSVLAEHTARQLRPVSVCPTKFQSLNAACSGTGGGKGFGQGDYIIVAGPTGGGKTVFALNLTAHALKCGINTLFVSLELSRDVILTRLKAIVTGEHVETLSPGNRFRREASVHADEMIAGLEGHLSINPRPFKNIDKIGNIVAAAEELVRVESVRLCVIDYVQLLSAAGRDTDLYAQMSSVSGELALLARCYDVTVIALSQYNRALAWGEEPHINHIFGSSRLGFDPDLVLGLDYSKFDRDPIRQVNRLHIKTLKANHGPAVRFPVEFSTASLRFTEVETDDRNDWSNR